jgi:hypothetical protein
MTSRALPLALLVAPVLVPAPAADPPAAAEAYSPVDAEALSRKLDALARRAGGGVPPRERAITVTEPELNAYLNLTLAPRIPKGVSDLVVKMEQDRLAAQALVDLSLVQDQLPAGSLGGLLSFLSGKVPLRARGRLVAPEVGFSAIALEEVSLSTIPVPMSVVEQLVASATRSPSSPQGFDIRSPFRLPYDLKRVRLEPGRARLEY